MTVETTIAIHSVGERVNTGDRRSLMSQIEQGWNGVIIDAESTLVPFESLNRLVAMMPNASKLVSPIRAITNLGMAGKITPNESITTRLGLLTISDEELLNLRAQCQQDAVKDAQGVIYALTAMGVTVDVISGGFRQTIEGPLVKLGVDPTHIHANTLSLEKGKRMPRVVGWSNSDSLAEGKVAYVDQSLDGLRRRHLVVGDGSTDAALGNWGENTFIGFGGVTDRDSVRKQAPIYTKSLAAVFVLAVGQGRWRDCYESSDPVIRNIFIKGVIALRDPELTTYGSQNDAVELYLRLEPFIDR